MDARGIILKLREREQLTDAEICWFAHGLGSGEVSEAQAGAFAMAVLLNGVTTPERVSLTLAMRDSGHVMSWDLPGPVVDKHSTGGLGDCVSLLLAPMLAAAGVYNPMISGRGLGHTGGTLDKLEAIPGLDTGVPEGTFRDLVRDIGCAIVSASADLAPADRRLYAVRDVTSTVESIDLITASILSKKLAAGPEALILDVKTGSAAFMETLEDAEALARSLVDTANGAGCRTRALITDMSQPLAPALGNAVEVAEVMRVFEGEPDPPLIEVTVALVSHLLVLCGAESDLDAAEDRSRETLESGAATEVFGRMVTALGGPKDFVTRWREHLPQAPVNVDVPAGTSGFVSSMAGHDLGMVVVHLGGGRLRGDDPIDPRVGLTRVARIGDRVEAGDPLAVVHAANEDAAAEAIAAVQAAIRISEEAPEAPKLIVEEVS